TELPTQQWEEPSAPSWNETSAPPWNETPAPAWQAPTAVDWQPVAQPPAPEAEPAGNRYAQGVPDSPTQTVLAVGRGGDRGGTQPPQAQPPQYLPQPAGPGPGAGYLPPGIPMRTPVLERRRGWRRLSVLVLVIATAVAIPVALVMMASARSNTGG